jgi:predicted O-linked N-acetylglucosamine transferase (SPINDLY family)
MNSDRHIMAEQLAAGLVPAPNSPGLLPQDGDEGLALYRRGEFEAAEAFYRRVLATRPKDVIALNNSALVAKALGRPEVALVRLAKAARYAPHSAQAHFNLANTLQECGRIGEAVESYQRAIELSPGYVKAHLNLGNALAKLHRLDDAAASYLKALAFGGDQADTHRSLGNCYRQQRKLAEALTHYTCAATLAPDRAEFFYDVGNLRYELQDYASAIFALNRVLELDPSHATAASLLLYLHQITCNWDEVARLAPIVRTNTDRAWAAGKPCGEGVLESLARDVDPERNFKVTRDAAAPFMAIAAPAPKPRASRRGARIKIGYLSADFRDHAVAHVMAGVIERHDRDRFEICAFSLTGPNASTWRRRIENSVDRFTDLTSLSDAKAIERIRGDHIDLLVDLTVWTRGNRPPLLAARPAALQLQYLGFPGSSAASYYDYALVDRTVVPPEHRPFWSESLIYLPHCYFCPDAGQPIASNGPGRAEWGLPDDAIVFCSFNQGYKIEPVVFSAWMRILAEIPGAVLWLFAWTDEVKENLRREAAARSIDPARIVFAELVEDKAIHLWRTGLADVALDTFVYNGHTTTSDALLAGVPVICVTGGHFASRVSASMLKAAGLGDLIARDIDDYVRIAVGLAHSPEDLASVRSRVRAALSGQPLFDTDGAVKAIEAGFEHVHRHFLDGGRPQDVLL